MRDIQISVGPESVRAVTGCSEGQAWAFLAWAVRHCFRAEIESFIRERWDDFIEDERDSLRDEEADRKLHAARDGD